MKKLMYPNIEAERARNGMSRDEFCEAVGITSSTYRSWQSGRFQAKINVLRKAAELFDVSVAYLTGEKEA